MLVDPDGTDAVSLEYAKEYAVAAAREIVAGRLKRGEIVDGDAFEITDEAGTVCEIIPFRSVFRLE